MRKRLLWTLVLGLLLLAGALRFGPLLSDPARVKAFLLEQGGWAPLAFVLLHAAQVILAPIPGQALDMLGGYLFGTFLGTFYSLAGMFLGSAVAFLLARRFGRPLVERVVNSRTLARLDDYARRRGLAFFFLVFLFPFLPDDVACFLAGLTPLPFPSFALVVAIGRLPGTLVACWTGAQVTSLTPSQWALFVTLLAPLALAFWRYQDDLERAMWKALTALFGPEFGD